MSFQTKKKKYWFRNKKFGIGWVPATWQGWSVLLIYIISVFTLAISPYYMGNGMFVTGKYVNLVKVPTINYLYFFLMFLAFMAVVILKGEKLKPNFISKFFNKMIENEESKKVEDRKP